MNEWIFVPPTEYPGKLIRRSNPMNERIYFFPFVPDPPMYCVAEYPEGIVHAVRGHHEETTVCEISLAHPHYRSPERISCQDCLCRLANGQGEV